MHVLSALEGARIGAILLAHKTFDLAERLVSVLLQPHAHLLFDVSNVLDPVPQEHAAKHRHIGAGQDHSDHVARPVNPARGREICPQLPEKDADPAQGKHRSACVLSISPGVTSIFSRSMSGW